MAGQGGCERKIEVFLKIERKKNNFFRGGGGRGWIWLVRGGQGGCERKFEVFLKIQRRKKNFFFWCGEGLVGRVRVDVNEELKFL